MWPFSINPKDTKTIPNKQEKQFDRVDHRPLPYRCRTSWQRVIANEITATRDDLLFRAVVYDS